MLENISTELVWFFLGFILLFAELTMPAFILLFFGVGAWVTALAVLLGFVPYINMQLLLFIVSSLLALVLFRKRVLFTRKRHAVKTNDPNHIGSHGMVLADIKPGLSSGKIELNGTIWKAIADEEIQKGNEVEIIDQVNLTLKVKRTNNK